MPDYKKTVKNLEALSNILAYDGDLQGMRTIDDALALLKEQEARVMTLDQVCGGDECWIEYKFGGHGYADVYLPDEPDGTALVYRCRPVGDRKPETLCFHDYGKLWRGWSYRPTDEQRKPLRGMIRGRRRSARRPSPVLRVRWRSNGAEIAEYIR